jgi:hypothetical protein
MERFRLSSEQTRIMWMFRDQGALMMQLFACDNYPRSKDRQAASQLVEFGFLDIISETPHPGMKNARLITYRLTDDAVGWLEARWP